MTAPIAITVIGGYLGTGKTTMVNHLLRHANGLHLAVLVNDFGELAIDADLIEAEGEDIISIAGGCVCCSFGNDLTGAIIKMSELEPRPDHLLIESSGVAIPSAIVGSISLMGGVRTDGIVILVDAETVKVSGQDKYMGDTVLRQISDANIIVLNKIDLVDATALGETVYWLKEQNPDVRIIEAEQGVVAPEAVLDSFLELAEATGRHSHIQSLEVRTLMPKSPVDTEALAKELAGEGSGLIRAKGFATSLSGQKTLIQVVGNRWTTSEAADHMEDGIVCLGFRDKISKGQIQSLGDEVDFSFENIA